MTRKELRSLIRARLLAGTIPNTIAAKTFGGNGNGADCDCCGLPIGELEIEYELDFAATEDCPSHSYLAHRECYEIWEAIVRVNRPR